MFNNVVVKRPPTGRVLVLEKKKEREREREREGQFWTQSSRQRKA